MYTFILDPKPFGTLKLASSGQLDCSASRDRARLSSQRRRKKPSLDHVRSLGNISMIFPENMPHLAIQEEEEGGGGDARHSVATPMKLPHAPPPKVKPRTQPRRRVSSPEPGENKSDETESPKPAKRPIPVPRSASKEKAGEGGGEPTEDKGKSSTPEVQPQTASPSRAKKPVRTSLHDDSTAPATSSPTPPTKKPKPVPPKPSPRTNTPVQDSSSQGDLLEGLKRKDPAELTVKEKMMLAQQAMAKQAEYKSKGMAPPVRKKMVPLPKSSSIDVSDSPTKQKRESKMEDDDKKEDEVDGGTMERSKSMEDLDDVTPKRQPRKLPPGAFNIGIPMGLPGETRHRSYTVASGASTDSNEHTQSTEEQPAQAENEEHNDDPEISRSDTQVSDKSQPSPQTTPKTTPKKSPMTTPIHSGTAESSPEISKKLPSSSSADNLDYSEDELDGPSPEIDQEEMLRGASHITSSATPDLENVLFWSPEVVGMWLGNIGLGSHAGAFKEKGVKGYLLFDMDNNTKLKVRERNVLLCTVKPAYSGPNNTVLIMKVSLFQRFINTCLYCIGTVTTCPELSLF